MNRLFRTIPRPHARHRYSLLIAAVAACALASPAFAQVPDALAPVGYDASLWNMFAAAVPAVKLVMVLLLAASLASWTVWIAKWMELRTSRQQLASVLVRLEQAHTLEAVSSADSRPVMQMIEAARQELAHSSALVRAESIAGIKERVAIRLHRSEAGATRHMSRGVGILATIGSVAPFVGLFGTVWGIMHSFLGIAASQKTSLAVVAPGIAEALLATALGLVAAIPATVMYNVFARLLAAYKGGLADSSSLVLCLVSRDLDHDIHGSAVERSRPALAAAVAMAGA